MQYGHIPYLQVHVYSSRYTCTYSYTRYMYSSSTRVPSRVHVYCKSTGIWPIYNMQYGHTGIAILNQYRYGHIEQYYFTDVAILQILEYTCTVHV